MKYKILLEADIALPKRSSGTQALWLKSFELILVLTLLQNVTIYRGAVKLI